MNLILLSVVHIWNSLFVVISLPLLQILLLNPARRSSILRHFPPPQLAQEQIQCLLSLFPDLFLFQLAMSHVSCDTPLSPSSSTYHYAQPSSTLFRSFTV